MLKVVFIKKGKGFRGAIKKLESQNKALKVEIMSSGFEVEAKMKDIIKTNKVRPQAGEPTTLENNITTEIFDDGEIYGWGVGNITRLMQNARHWAVVNWGSSHMVGKRLPKGIFDPGIAIPHAGSFRSGRWKKGINKGGSMYSPIVTKPIQPINYIEKTVRFVNRRLNKLKTIFSR